LKHIQNNTGLIAIVDDDEPVREALSSVLKAAGFSVNSFNSGEEFLNSSQFDETACLILDIRLPGMSGAELQKAISEAENRVPIIFVTAHGDAALRYLLMKAGAVDFLNKPVRSDVLLRAIETALGSKVGK
jgi:FixJ family two-component response regulator